MQKLGDLYRRVYLGWNYRLRTSGWVKYCLPTDIAFLMTNLCNARCVHCDIWKNKGKEDAPTVEEYKATLSELRKWLGPVPVFFSGGEALLRPQTIDLLTHSSAIGLHAELLTHGYWDDQDRIEKVALANPARVTVSLDGIGETHTKIRGREKFFEKTTRSLETLRRIRAEKRLRFVIRLKTVVMEHNIGDLAAVAGYAAENGFEVFYQPIEQNYNTPEDSRWYEHSENWPKDPARAKDAVRELMALKQRGLPIRNSMQQLETMVSYLGDPDRMRVAVQDHSGHEKVRICAASTFLQIMPNGDVLSCSSMPAVGNIRSGSIREIWRRRPAWWHGGCCQEARCTPAERENKGLVVLG
jgi:MoaA/NifB/PqqE/SkfB family radical SAM enzyme